MDERLNKKLIGSLYIAKDLSSDLNVFLELPVFDKSTGTYAGNHVAYLGKSTDDKPSEPVKLCDIEVNLAMTPDEKESIEKDHVNCRIYQCPTCGKKFAFSPDMEGDTFSFFCGTCHERECMDMQAFMDLYPVLEGGVDGEFVEPVCEVCGCRMSSSCASATYDNGKFEKRETFICRECGNTLTVTTH